MKHIKRRANGRYLSQKEWERKEIRRAKVYTLALMSMAIVGYVSLTSKTTTYFAPEVEAHEIAIMENVELCELQAIECTHESPITKATQAVSEALGREVTEETKKRIKYLHERATEHSVPFYDAVKTVYCESMWVSQKSHLPEESYGIAQIHLPSHKTVTREQAMDAYFAIDFMVDNWEGTKWYGYDRSTGTCTNGLKINL